MFCFLFLVVLLLWPLKGTMLLAKAWFYWMMWLVREQSCPSWTVATATGVSMTAHMLRMWESGVHPRATQSWMAAWVTCLASHPGQWGSSFDDLLLWKLWQMWEFSLCCLSEWAAFWAGLLGTSPGSLGARLQSCGSTRPTASPSEKVKLERIVLVVSKTNLRDWGMVAALVCCCSLMRCLSPVSVGTRDSLTRPFRKLV